MEPEPTCETLDVIAEGHIGPFVNIVIAIDPGWKNMGYTVVMDFSNGERKVLIGTHDLAVPVYTKNQIPEIARAMTTFMRFIAGYYSGYTPYFEALIIEQQPVRRTDHIYLRLQELQITIETTVCCEAIRCSGDMVIPPVYRFNANSYRKAFGISSKNTTHAQRKRTLLEKINALCEDPDQKAREKYPLVIPCKNDHEADSLACYNVYITRKQNGQLESNKKGLIVKKRSIQQLISGTPDRPGDEQQEPPTKKKRGRKRKEEKCNNEISQI